MKVLIACEFSGIVREAFRARGHNAWSCDLLPPEYKSLHHYQRDVISLISRSNDAEIWDFIGAHPPCDNLCVSGARWFEQKRQDGRQQASIEFFMSFVRVFEKNPKLRGYIENSVGIMSTLYRKPDQIIQPHMFGHPEFKATCLWLFNLQPLVPTDILTPPIKGTPERAQWSRVHRASPGPNRWKERSRTFPRIGAAMAEQWG